MAKLLDTNVVLVIDSNGITRGVAPLLMGYQTFDTNVNIVGVILNKVAGERQVMPLLSITKTTFVSNSFAISALASPPVVLMPSYKPLLPCSSL
jgi:cobyrinic acid a,c-diamide synthase